MYGMTNFVIREWKFLEPFSTLQKSQISFFLCHKEDFSSKIHPSSWLTNSPNKKLWAPSYWVALSPLSWSKIFLVTLLSIMYAIKFDLKHIFTPCIYFLSKNRKRRKRLRQKNDKNQKFEQI